MKVWIDQDLCTGDGLCVQLAPEVFEFDIDGLAYVKGGDGELLTVAGARVSKTLKPRENLKKCDSRCTSSARSGASLEPP